MAVGDQLFDIDQSAQDSSMSRVKIDDLFSSEISQPYTAMSSYTQTEISKTEQPVSVMQSMYHTQVNALTFRPIKSVQKQSFHSSVISLFDHQLDNKKTHNRAVLLINKEISEGPIRQDIKHDQAADLEERRYLAEDILDPLNFVYKPQLPSPLSIKFPTGEGAIQAIYGYLPFWMWGSLSSNQQHQRYQAANSYPVTMIPAVPRLHMQTLSCDASITRNHKENLSSNLFAILSIIIGILMFSMMITQAIFV